jgi:hypothetical protein
MGPCHLAVICFLFESCRWVISVIVLCFINVLLLLFIVYIFSLLSFHFLPVIGFSVVNHLRTLLFLLLLFILLIFNGIPDSLIIKSEYPISFSHLRTIPTTEIIVCRKYANYIMNVIFLTICIVSR